MAFIRDIIYKDISIAPLITFRVLFGFIMVVSILRFWYHGWIYDLYIEPTYYFSYFGVDWITSLGDPGMYILFFVIFMSAIGIMLGAYYRLSIITFFIAFTYVELIDKTNYLNHYYFVSIISFLLILVPAHRHWSLDSYRYPSLKATHVPSWCIHIFKLQLVLVYLFAGVAKLNPSWLVDAMPLALWLPAKTHIPIIGPYLQYEVTAYLFSWCGAVYDLTIGFLLLWSRTRVLAFVGVVVFHLLTALLFQIGMFPYIMMISTLIFFSGDAHLRVYGYLSRQFNISFLEEKRVSTSVKLPTFILTLYLMIQLIAPLRYLAYEGDLFWTELGYRFSWRVMLMEKAGHTTFRIEDKNGKKEWVQNHMHLTPQQEKMMSTQPDMILQYAQYLSQYYKERGFDNPAVYCDSKVTLNGRRSKTFVDPNQDLNKIKRGWGDKNWIKPFEYE